MPASSSSSAAAAWLLAILSACGLDGTPPGPPGPANSPAPEPVEGVSAKVDGTAIDISHAIAYSEYGTKYKVVFADHPLGCDAADGILEPDQGNHVLLSFQRRIQSDGSYPWTMTDMGLFPQSLSFKEPRALDWTLDEDTRHLSGTIDLTEVLPASEVFNRPEHTLAIGGTFRARYCGTTGTFQHPSRPQEDLRVQVTGNTFPITSAILRPVDNLGARWALQLGSNPASCDSSWPDGPVLVTLTYTEAGEVTHAHLYGEGISPQLNYNVAATDATIRVQGASPIPESGEVELTVDGAMAGLVHRLRLSGTVSATICPKR